MVRKRDVRMLAETPHYMKFMFTLHYLLSVDAAWLDVSVTIEKTF